MLYLGQKAVLIHPDGKRGAKHTVAEDHKRDRHMNEAVIVFRDRPVYLRQNAGSGKGDQQQHGKLPRHEIENGSNKAHDEDGSRLLHLRFHQHKWNAGENSRNTRQQQPEHRYKSGDHCREIQYKIQGGKNADGDQVSALQLSGFMHGDFSFILQDSNLPISFGCR